jgi:oxygen-dependent protoporphyrinogen oxidase
VGHLERLASIDHELQHTPGLLITGTSFRGNGIPNCIADGRATAAARAVQ